MGLEMDVSQSFVGILYISLPGCYQGEQLMRTKTLMTTTTIAQCSALACGCGLQRE